MNIAFVSNVVYPFVTGGAQKRINEIGSRLAERNHDVTVYGRHFWDGPRVMRHNGMTLHAVASEADLYKDDRRSIGEAIDFSARLAPKLRKQLKGSGHDVVVASVFPYFPVLSSKLAAVGIETPLVTTWHEVWSDYWEEYLGSLAPFGKFTENITARTPQYPITVSSVTANRLSEIGPSKEKIKVVPNGIDVEQVRGAPVPENSYDILFAGRLIENKNVDTLLKAFDEISHHYNVTLGIIGDGPERERLEELGQGLTHADRIEFLGFLTNYEDVLGHMRAAEIFASPSTREGFGITLAEAMAANCTVIAVDHQNSAADEVVGGAGFLVNPTVESLSKALAAVISGEQPVEDPLDRAKKYDWDKVTQKAELTYRHAINGSW